MEKEKQKIETDFRTIERPKCPECGSWVYMIRRFGYLVGLEEPQEWMCVKCTQKELHDLNKGFNNDEQSEELEYLEGKREFCHDLEGNKIKLNSRFKYQIISEILCPQDNKPCIHPHNFADCGDCEEFSERKQRSDHDPKTEIRDQKDRKVIPKIKINPEILQKLKKGLWYIAYPYSKDPEGNYRKCIEFTNKLLDLGIMGFSPIILTHRLAKSKKRGYSFWMKFDGKYWEFMQGIILPINHEESKGCNIERNWFKEHNKPIFIFDDIAIDFYKW